MIHTLTGHGTLVADATGEILYTSGLQTIFQRTQYFLRVAFRILHLISIYCFFQMNKNQTEHTQVCALKILLLTFMVLNSQAILCLHSSYSIPDFTAQITGKGINCIF